MFTDGMPSQSAPQPWSLSQTRVRHTFIRRLIRVGAGLWVFAALAMLLWLGEGVVTHDLRVVAPSHVAPGQSLPIRAFLYGELSSVTGARLVSGKLTASLLAPAQRSMEEVELRPGLAGSFEGMLVVPETFVGDALLRVAAEPSGGNGKLALVVKITVAKVESAPALPVARSLRAMQQLHVGPLIGGNGSAGLVVPRLKVGGPTVRIRGGICAPEVPCRVFVRWPKVADEPGASLLLQGSRSLNVLDSLWVTGADGAGLMVATVRIHGPEAHGQLIVRGSTGERRRAALRLPVALGSQVMAAGDRWVLAGPDGGSCILDGFVGNRWLWTETYPDCETRQPWALDVMSSVISPVMPPTAPSRERVRLQWRRDPFSAAGSAVRMLDPSGGQLESDPFTPSKPRWAAAWREFVAAGLETGIQPLPPAQSGYEAAVKAARDTRSRMMGLAALAVVGAGLVLLFNIGVSGATAAAEAETIMVQAGQSRPGRLRAARRRTAQLWASLFALAIAFAAIAIYLWVRY